MTPELCAAANDTRSRGGGTRALILTISFVPGPGVVVLRSLLLRPVGQRPPLYLLHYLSVNTNRMDASDGLKFP